MYLCIVENVGGRNRKLRVPIMIYVHYIISILKISNKMKKYVLDLKVVSVEALSDKHVLIKLTDEKPLPEILPGQFVEVRVDHSPTTMLRRPISINFVDRENNQLWLLVAMVGGRYSSARTAQGGRCAQSVCCLSATASPCLPGRARNICS